MWLQQNHSLDTKRFLKDVKQRLQDMEYQKWMSEIFNDKGRTGKQSNKLRVYRTFKTEYKYESYLDHIINTKHRINLTRLRISNHNLEIEKGRHRKPYVEPQDRTCPVCKKEVEDEIHFLLRCSYYSNLRESFFQSLKMNVENR